jgi:hypothetical protein
MKLIGKTRSVYNYNLYLQTDYTLDSLGRRIEEVSYKSTDQQTWLPCIKKQYVYSGEMWDSPCQFEKYNLYLPDWCFYNSMSNWGYDNLIDAPYEPFYMNDTWKISNIYYSTYNNQEWSVPYTGDYNLQTGGSEISVHASYGRRYNWTSEGIPTHISEGDNSYWENYYYFNSPSANNDEVNQVPPAFSISSYPNPNNGECSLRIKAEKQQPVSVITYNLRGQKLKEEVLPASASGNIAHAWKAIDGQGNPLPKGIYLIKAVSGKQSAIIRVTSLK